MLILTLNVGEVIHVGEDIKIEVFKAPGRRLQVSLIAPKSVKLKRVKKDPVWKPSEGL